MKLPDEIRQILNSIPVLINKTIPVPGRFRGKLPGDTAELSRLLTGARGDRSLSYLSRPNFLSGYLRYFLQWNIYRLCRLLPSLDIRLSAGDKIADLGSGPLTFVLALWISRSDLRKIPLEFHCIDRSAPALEAGEKIFASLSSAAGESSNWKIKLVKEDINFRKEPKFRGKNGYAFVSAVNLFNEIYEKIPHSKPEDLRQMAAGIAAFMHGLAAQDACFFTVEPGVPQSGRFINFLRSAFLRMECPPLSPCTHSAACPASGGKKRWCHFAFETDDAPKELRQFSAAAKLPKERVVFSYLYTGKGNIINSQTTTPNPRSRVISDMFPVADNRFGRYCCSEKGLVLLTGEKSKIEKNIAHSLVIPAYKNKKVDEKSGALIAEECNYGEKP